MKFSLFFKIFIKNLILAFVFVSPIYNLWLFEWGFEQELPLWLNSICGVLGLYVFLGIPKKERFVFGFCVGVLCFYWIGYSFVFFGFPYLVPLIAIIVALIYMVLFSLVLWSENLYWRGVGILLLGFVHPFGFDWFVVQSFFAYSYFGVETYMIILLLMGVIFLRQIKLKFSFVWLGVSLVCLGGAVDWQIFQKEIKNLAFKVALIETNFSQDAKWQRENARRNALKLMEEIAKAVREGKELIVLPETAFPFVLQRSPYFSELQQISQNTTLVVGTLRREKNKLYNSTYVFSKGEFKVFDKVVLAPFGEKIPLPNFLAKPLEKVFFGEGSLEFESSQDFGSFQIKDMEIRPVICYEGTSQVAYENAPPYLIVISNNAWFPNTLEPVLQKTLMKYYARKYQKVILHSSNGSPSFVLFP